MPVAADLAAVIIVVVVTVLVVVAVLGLHVWGAIQDGREADELRLKYSADEAARRQGGDRDRRPL